MKKILVVIIVLFFFATPLWAAGVLEGGLVGVAAGTAVGGVVGAVIGGIGGLVLGGVKEVADEKVKKEEYTAQSSALQITNTELEYQNKNLMTSINAWQTDYDSRLGTIAEAGQEELKNRKENWGLTNATLASREQGGRTAQLLSQEAKKKIVSYAGEDMSLSSASAEQAVANAYSSVDTSSLSTLSSNKNYGLYELSLIDTMTTLRQNKKTLEDQIAINEEAILANKGTIKRYNKLKKDLFFYKYGGLV